MFISSYWNTLVYGIVPIVAVILLVLLIKNKISVRTSYITIGAVITMAITITSIPSFTPEAKEVRAILTEHSDIQRTAKQCVKIHGELTPYLKEKIETYNQSVDALDTDSFWTKVLTDNNVSKYRINEQELKDHIQQRNLNPLPLKEG